MRKGRLILENNAFDRAFEEERLKKTISLAKEQLSALRAKREEKEDEIVYLKKEMTEVTAHSIPNLWSTDNFYDLVQLSQYANSVSDKAAGHDHESNKIMTLERIIDSPYFARIDFKFDNKDAAENIYIGLSTLLDEQTYKIYVYDWRSPVASVFYRFTTGKVSYEAPAGTIHGEVSLKRQYEIKDGKLEYFFDADIQIIDEFLRLLLSKNASPSMKSIVETIQRDQDIIIRDMETDLLMVQGVAGSGKTSVALHRAAYLMYKGLSSNLSSNDIVIISPNTLFERYISNVLPELGENNVDTVLFEQILRSVLKTEDIQSRNEYLECLLTSGDKKYRDLLKSSMEFKCSDKFTGILKRFITELPNKRIEFSDVYYDGKHIETRQLLKMKLLKQNKGALLAFRLEQLEKSITESIHEKRKMRMKKLRGIISRQPVHVFEAEEVARMLSILESTALIKNIRKFTRLDCFSLYKELFADKNSFYRLAKGIKLPDNIEEIINFTLKNLEKDRLQYDDALALVFLNLKTKGYTDYAGIKQVVIDEAQDYHPIHFEILNALFSKARFTVLGDVNQTIGKHEDISLYDRLRNILNRKKSALVTLDKSFRCTSEILAFSSQFLDSKSGIRSFSRSGDVPKVIAAGSPSALDDLIIEEISTCQEKGYRSIALVCKTEQDSISLHERLKSRTDIRLVKSGTVIDLSGVFIIPVYMAKGLEFDAVLLCDVDNRHYNSEDDKNLLYIACTRALHRLNLFYTGDKSVLLQ